MNGNHGFPSRVLNSVFNKVAYRHFKGVAVSSNNHRLFGSGQFYGTAFLESERGQISTTSVLTAHRSASSLGLSVNESSCVVAIICDTSLDMSSTSF